MEKEQMDEWQSFRVEAVQLVHTGWPLGKGRKMFQLIILPSFQNSISWELIQTGMPSDATLHNEREFTVVRTTWRMEVDIEKFRTPIERLRFPRPLKPTMEQTQWPAKTEDADRWINQFAAALPSSAPVRHKSIGVDGTDLQFSFGNSLFKWWYRAPTEWTALEERFTATFHDFEAIAKNA